MDAAQAASWAQVATAIVTFVALLFAWIQVRSARRSQMEATAKQIYAAYQQRAFEYPQFAVPQARDPNEPFDELRYRMFVSSLLIACEEILAMSKDPLWQLTMKKNLAFHAEYLKSDKFKDFELELCDPELQQLINEVVSDKSRAGSLTYSKGWR